MSYTTTEGMTPCDCCYAVGCMPCDICEYAKQEAARMERMAARDDEYERVMNMSDAEFAEYVAENDGLREF